MRILKAFRLSADGLCDGCVPMAKGRDCGAAGRVEVPPCAGVKDCSARTINRDWQCLLEITVKDRCQTAVPLLSSSPAFTERLEVLAMQLSEYLSRAAKKIDLISAIISLGLLHNMTLMIRLI